MQDMKTLLQFYCIVITFFIHMIFLIYILCIYIYIYIYNHISADLSHRYVSLKFQLIFLTEKLPLELQNAVHITRKVDVIYTGMIMHLFINDKHD